VIVKLKRVVVFESIVIGLLLVALIYSYANNHKINAAAEKNQTKQGLLSPRVYAGLIEPKSFLIVNFAPLKEKVENYISKNNLNVSVYVENLRNGAYMGINEKTGFFPASLNKLPVAILIMKKIEEGDLSLDTMLEIKDIDRTDSSGNFYKTKEKEIPLRVVLEKMLKESDNTALRILLRQVDLEDLQLILDYYGIDINVDYQKQQKEKHPDLITPKAMSTFLSSIYFSIVLEPKDSEYLLSLLKNTIFDINAAANLPNNITVVHKFGDNYYGTNKFFHDCGIMYIEDSRILYCIMTKDVDKEQAVETIGVIVNEIYHYVEDTRARLKTYKYSK